MSGNPSSTALSTNSNTTNAGSLNNANANSKSPLLHAWHDPLANIRTNTSCVRLVDLNCDGDSKLCICDHDKKMRVYKGTNLVMEYAILDVPTAMCITYMEVSLVRFISLFPPNVLLKYPFIASHASCRDCGWLSCVHLSSASSLPQSNEYCTHIPLPLTTYSIVDMSPYRAILRRV
jgi:hypothetical protein